MTIRCGCPDEGDDIVFGPVHQCAEPIADLVATAALNSVIACPSEPRYLETLDEDERRGH